MKLAKWRLCLFFASAMNEGYRTETKGDLYRGNEKYITMNVY